MKISNLYLSLLSLVTISCSNGTCKNNTPPTTNAQQLSIKPSRLLPSLVTQDTITQAQITNNSESTLTNLDYSLTNQKGGGNNVSISPSSQSSCQLIEAHTSCNLDLIVESGSIAGSLTLHVANNSLNINSAPLGVQQVPINNSESGANSITLLYTPTILQIEDITYVMISYVINSTLTPDFNTITLVDQNNNPLTQINLSVPTTQLVSGSSGSIMVELNSSIQFKVQTANKLNDGSITNLSISNQEYAINLVNNQAILTQLPQALYLSELSPSQEVLLVNDGTQTITNLNASASTNTQARLSSTIGNLNITIASTELESNTSTGSTVSLIDATSNTNSNLNYNGLDNLNNPISAIVTVNENQPLVPNTVCEWEEVGDASTFFNSLNTSQSAMGLSPDGQFLYVAGQMNGGSPTTVAKIDLIDGTQWSTVANADTVINNNLDIIHALEVVQISTESIITYVGGRNTNDGEHSTVYTSTNDDNWISSSIRSDLGYNANNNYEITGFSSESNIIYAVAKSTSNTQNSFIARRIATADWAYFGNGEPGNFNNVSLQTILSNQNNDVYIGGVNSDGEAALYALPDGVFNWNNIVTNEYDFGPIYSLALIDGVLYTGGRSDNSYATISKHLQNNTLENISNTSLGYGSIYSLLSQESTLYAGGSIESRIIATPTNNINWSTVWSANNTLDGNVTEMKMGTDGTIYADGEFSQHVVRLKCQ